MQPTREQRLGKLRRFSQYWFAGAKSAHSSGALIETAFLMAAADGNFGPEEQTDVCEAIEYLTGGNLDGPAIQGVLDRFVEALQRDGWDTRIAAVVQALSDPGMRRNAYRLAAGISFGDGEIQPDEQKLFGMLAEAFEIPMDEASLILVEVRDLLYRAGPDEATVSELPPSMRRT